MPTVTVLKGDPRLSLHPPTKVIDLSQQVCPYPSLNASKILKQLNPGEVVEFLVDYKPTAEVSIPFLCQQQKCSYLVSQKGDNWSILAKKE